jgi:hypothetical protein
MSTRLGDPIDKRIPWVRRIDALEEARAVGSAGPRLTALRRAGERLGAALRNGPRVVSVRTLPLRTVLYPMKHAFNGAVPLPFPFILFYHRCLLVQVLSDGRIRNVLWNPTDTEASKQTPFFKNLIDKFGERAANLLSTEAGTVESQLAKLGLSPGEIDLIAFDHFHTQDLRPALGTVAPDAEGNRLPARFPNAYLLAPKREWHDWDDLHPLQRTWFVADGKRGVPADRVVLFDADVALGDGCLVLRTHGHTTGNHTIFCHTDGGVFGCSENGTSADNWSPHESRIPGLRRYVKHYGLEVVLNSNTPELGAEQYTSMILERTVVDRVPDRPAFVQMFPSSEVVPSAIAPGVRPSMVFHHRTSGTVQLDRPAAQTEQQRASAMRQ